MKLHRGCTRGNRITNCPLREIRNVHAVVFTETFPVSKEWEKQTSLGWKISLTRIFCNHIQPLPISPPTQLLGGKERVKERERVSQRGESKWFSINARPDFSMHKRRPWKSAQVLPEHTPSISQIQALREQMVSSKSGKMPMSCFCFFFFWNRTWNIHKLRANVSFSHHSLLPDF